MKWFRLTKYEKLHNIGICYKKRLRMGRVTDPETLREGMPSAESNPVYEEL